MSILFTFSEHVCRGSGGSPRGPVGHLSDEKETLGPRNPFTRVPMPSFDKKIWKNRKKLNNKSQRAVCKGVHGNSSIGNSLGTTWYIYIYIHIYI